MTINRETIYTDVAGRVLEGLKGRDAEEGQALVRLMVDEWLNTPNVDLDDMVRIGTADLENALQGQKPKNRLATLRHLVLERRVQTLAGQAFQLAKQVVDQPSRAEELHTKAHQIADAIDGLLPDVKAIKDAALQKRLLRELADADLEMRYVLDGATGIMSLRLNHYAQSK